MSFPRRAFFTISDLSPVNNGRSIVLIRNTVCVQANQIHTEKSSFLRQLGCAPVPEQPCHFCLQSEGVECQLQGAIIVGQPGPNACPGGLATGLTSPRV